MAGSYLVNVPKLKGRENYDEWAFAAENFLILEGMDIKKKKDAVTVTEADDQKAKAKLIMTIDSSLYVHVRNEKTANEVWERLKSLFDDSGFQRKISLLRHLISIRLESSESMTSYVTQIVDTSQKLRGTGFQITDEWIGCLLLAGLTEKFAPMIMAIEHSGMTVSTDAIKSKLLDMSAEVGSNGNGESALLSRGWQRSNKSGSTADMSKPSTSSKTSMSEKSVKTIRCYKCKQLGHYRNQCTETKQKQVNAFSAAFLNAKFSTEDWYVDSGASAHMTANKEKLLRVREVCDVKEIVVANQMSVPVLCAGETQITTKVNNFQFDITVRDILYIPNLATNLLSVSQLIANGNKVTFKNNVCHIHNQQNELIGVADLQNGVYKLNIVKSDKVLAAAVQTTDANQWHRRLGHINSNDLQKMKDGAVEGVSYDDKADIRKSNCEVCCEGKQSRLPFPHKGHRSEKLLELIHSDLCGPMETRSIGQARYFLLFVDDASRMTFVYFIKEKNQVLQCFKEFQKLVENQVGARIKMLRSDNGGEFCSNEMESFFK